LARHHDAIVFAYGASKDQKLGLDGEDNIKNVYSARAFVGWYNGLPEYRDLNPNLTAGDDAIIIGQGNVALDVARILLTDIDVLRKTDITTWALERLAESRIKHIRIVGRRGPVQAAFTIKEARELMQLPDTHFKPIPAELFPPDVSSLPRPQKRIMQLLQKGSACGPGAQKSWSLDFLLSPQSLSSSPIPSDASHKTSTKTLTGVTFTQNTLADPFSPTSALLPSNEGSLKLHIPTSTLFRSIGYKSEPLAGSDELGISFDERRGIIENDGLGRVLPSANKTTNSNPLPGLYCTGWVKRGPTGVIASTMNDAFATAESIATDWNEGRPFLKASGEGWRGFAIDAQKLGTKVEPVDWQKWERIDRVERARGEQQGRVRDKLGRVSEMLAVVNA
jgi:adrenodoxin-NADP+ reductase